jgi:hypothetical protein
MSISPVASASPSASARPVASASPAAATDGTLKAQSVRDQQRLLTDTRAQASESQLAADRLAVARDQQALIHSGRSRVDTKL